MSSGIPLCDAMIASHAAALVHALLPVETAQEFRDAIAARAGEIFALARD
ncbi:MAG: hypothetical protein ACR2NZ_18490 [Rubripirellula sp.]